MGTFPRRVTDARVAQALADRNAAGVVEASSSIGGLFRGRAGSGSVRLGCVVLWFCPFQGGSTWATVDSGAGRAHQRNSFLPPAEAGSFPRCIVSAHVPLCSPQPAAGGRRHLPSIGTSCPEQLSLAMNLISCPQGQDLHTLTHKTAPQSPVTAQLTLMPSRIPVSLAASGVDILAAWSPCWAGGVAASILCLAVLAPQVFLLRQE